MNPLVCIYVFQIQSSSSSSRGPPLRPCPASDWSPGCTPGSSGRRARSPCRSCGRPRPAPRMCSGPEPGSGSPARRSDGRGWRSRSVGTRKENKTRSWRQQIIVPFRRIRAAPTLNRMMAVFTQRVNVERLTSQPILRRKPWSSLEIPPITATVRMPRGLPNFMVSSSICCASSRVGARITA